MPSHDHFSSRSSTPHRQSTSDLFLIGSGPGASSRHDRVLGRGDLLVLIGAFAALVVSVGLWFSGSRDEGLFVGLWVPSILALGTFFNTRLHR